MIDQSLPLNSTLVENLLPVPNTNLRKVTRESGIPFAGSEPSLGKFRPDTFSNYLPEKELAERIKKYRILGTYTSASDASLEQTLL